MKIKTITCHDVYNAGASLQAYALQQYLRQRGHDVEIVDYKPEYLSRHYKFTVVNNSKYDKPFIRELYILAHFPQRLRAFIEGKKQRFDRFKYQFLKVTDKRYHNCEELKEELPQADCYIAGSDQIWNPYLPNGSDPSFYLRFASNNSRKMSYAASFATDMLPKENINMIRPWLERFNAISVREKSGVSILREMGLKAISVCDPVFLLGRKEWEGIAAQRICKNPYVLLYDFDGNMQIQEIATKLARRNDAEVLSVFTVKNKNIQTQHAVGPLEFLSLVLYSNAIVSNSFHAVAFSLIFHKEFYALRRSEKLNARIVDLLSDVGLRDRLVNEWRDCGTVREIDWNVVDQALNSKIQQSKDFLDTAIMGLEEDA